MSKFYCKSGYQPLYYQQSCRGLLLIVAAIIFFTSASASATQDSVAVAKDNTLQNNSQDIETINIVGEYPLAYFRRNLVRKENAFFSLMNTLVPEDDFKVSCEKRRIQTFSRLKERTCEANFVSRITDEYTQRNFDFLSQGSVQMLAEQSAVLALGNPFEVQQKIKRRQQEQLLMMVELINSNPDLLTAYNELEIAKHQLKLKKSM